MMENERRKKALYSLNIMNVSQLLAGLLLLVLGIVSRSQHGHFQQGVPPYFSGAFIGTAAACVQSVLGFIICFRGKNCTDKDTVARKLGLLMQIYSVSSIVCDISYVTGILLVGFTGICESSDCSYTTNSATNQRLAITIIVFIIVGMIFSAIGIAIVCIVTSSFGLKMFSRGQYKISPIETIENVIAEVPYDADTAAIEAVASVQPAQTGHLDLPRQHVPRLPVPDFSTQQNFLTQQSKARVKKRKRKNKERDKDKRSSNETRHRRRNGREAHYVLPPLSMPGHNHMIHEASARRSPASPSPPPTPTVFRSPTPPLRASPSPPPPPRVFLPPTPPPPPSPTPPGTPYFSDMESSTVNAQSISSSSLPPTQPESSPCSTEDSATLPVPRPPTPPRPSRQAFESVDYTLYSTPRTTRSVFITQLYTPEYSPTPSDNESHFSPAVTPPPSSPTYNGSRVIHVIPCGENLEDDTSFNSP